MRRRNSAQNETINVLKKSVSDGKSAVASAITAQGVTTAADAEFSVVAENVKKAGDARYNKGVAAAKVGTAAASQVLSGRTFTNASSVGATGTMPNRGAWTSGILVEGVETRRVVEALKPMFESAGCEVIPCTVDKAASQNAYLDAVVKMANQQDLDWFISIHFNNDAARKGQGVEAYTYKGRQYPDAVEVCEHIAALGFENRGVKVGTGLYVIRKTKAKVLLIEVCFVNEPDASTYKRMFEDICKAIAYAIADYVEAPEKPSAPSVLPEKKRYVKVICKELTVRKTPAWSGNAAGTVRKNEVFTIAEGPIKVGGGRMYKLKSGLYITASEKYVKVYEK